MPVPGGGARPASVPEYSRGWGAYSFRRIFVAHSFEVRVWCTSFTSIESERAARSSRSS